MRVLRDNKESLMAVLEAFVYDPLINWKLALQPSPATPNDAVTEPIPNPVVAPVSNATSVGDGMGIYHFLGDLTNFTRRSTVEAIDK
jgi:phosphatidylinositol kinase/protein kinase (PI-3  family)